MTMLTNVHDQTYANLLVSVLKNGEHVTNRTGEDTISLLGVQAKYDLSKGIPAMTLRKFAWEKSLAEMLWFISGQCYKLDGLVQTNRAGEVVDARNIWEPWATDGGRLGPIYGAQWREWYGHQYDDFAIDGVEIDQLANVVEQIKAKSTSRRLIVSAWNAVEIESMALPPCHTLFQFTVRNNKLHLQLYQRSCDLPIGGPFNIFQYSTLLLMVAKLANLEPGTFTHTIHDAHIYVNQIEQVKEVISRAYSSTHPAPKLIIHGVQETIDDFKLENFELCGYTHDPHIKIPVAV